MKKNDNRISEVNNTIPLKGVVLSYMQSQRIIVYRVSTEVIALRPEEWLKHVEIDFYTCSSPVSAS